MAKDRLTEDILNAIKPPQGNWQTSRSQAVFALLFGAAASLIRCRNFVDRYISSMPPRWDRNIDQLYNDFINEAVKKNNTIKWDASDDLFVWSMGFFLNRAQQNIAASLDVCTNTWLVWRLKWDFDEITEIEEGVFYFFITTRLRILTGLVADKSAKKIDRLLHNFNQDRTDTAKKYLEELNQKYKQESAWLSVCDLYDYINPHIEDEVCAAIVFEQVNSFKHRVRGYRLKREGIGHLTEWVLTAKALRCAGNFWQGMVGDWRVLQQRKAEKKPLRRTKGPV